MVMKGQLLERPVVVPAGGPCLDAIYLRGGAPSLLVASPLPGLGGSMLGPVGCELAYAAAWAGCASLRLDYRGVGASEGARSDDPREAARDLARGVDFLLETTRTERVALAACFSGAWPALHLARDDARIDRLLLVAPPWSEAPEGTPPYDAVGRPILIVAAGEDPRFDRAAEVARVDAARNARLEVFPRADAPFRACLSDLARLVPSLLGRHR